MTSYKQVLVVLLGLAACEPVTVYHNPHVSEARMDNDLLNCEVAALKNAPVAMKTSTSPGHWVPKEKKCNKKGKCTKKDGYWVPGDTYSVDVNKGLRKDLEERCMARKGYQPVELPECFESGSGTTSPGGHRRMPPLTENSCVVRDGNRRWKIVNPSN